MDELRDSIWDYLFQAGEPKSIVDVAAFCGHEPQTISAVVDHEWFDVNQDKVAIAYDAGSSQGGAT